VTVRGRGTGATGHRVPGGLDLFALACAFAALAAAAILSRLVFGGIPHVQDSIAQLFQARIFAEGRVWASSLAGREAFDYAHMINDGRWYAQYPPGHALLLVPGVWLGVPWLINPLLGALSVYAVYLLGRETHGPAVGRVAALLGLLSPFLLLMSAEFMAHASALLAVTAFLVFHLKMVRTGRMADAVRAGLFLLLAVLIRPYSALAVAVPMALHGAAWVRGDLRGRWRKAAVWALGGAAGAALLGLYNLLTTGDPLVPGYIRLYGESHGIGFGKGSWGPPHTLERGLAHAGSTLASLNGRLFEWPASSLWPLLVALLPLRRPSRATGEGTGDAAAGLDRAAWLLFAPVAALVVAHVLYWYHDLCFGPRYVYEALGPLLVLSAAGLRTVADGLAALGRGGRTRAAAASSRHARLVLAGIVIVLTLAAAVTGWPRLFRLPEEARGAPAGSGPRMASYFQHFGREYWGVSPYLGELVDREVRERPALVICRFREFQPEGLQFRHLWFGSACAHQPPDDGDDRVLFAQDRGEEANQRLALAYPAFAVYGYDGTIEAGTLTRLRGAAGRP